MASAARLSGLPEAPDAEGLLAYLEGVGVPGEELKNLQRAKRRHRKRLMMGSPTLQKRGRKKMMHRKPLTM